jgi:hypothetical protein
MPRENDTVTLRITQRELATILAALRFHQDENLQTGHGIPDRVIKELATDSGHLSPMTFEEVGRLCGRLKKPEGGLSSAGLVIEPPPKDSGKEPLYRVVYVIDVNAVDPLDAARQTHRIMADPGSMAPVLEVMDHRGHVVRIDLSDEEPPRTRKDTRAGKTSKTRAPSPSADCNRQERR